jgi:hypothetical protein
MRGFLTSLKTACSGLLALFALVASLSVPVGQAAAELPEQEIIALVQQATAQGRSAEEVNRIVEHAKTADSRGLPADTLVDKIREGLAKGVESPRLERVVVTMRTHLETAQDLLEEVESQSSGDNTQTQASRQRAIKTLAEALGRGATSEEVKGLSRSMRDAGVTVRAGTLAAGAKGLALMKEGGLPVPASTALILTAVQRGVPPRALLDLARELKADGQGLRDNPARLQAIQQAIERGERVEKPLQGLRERNEQRGRDGDSLNRIDRPNRDTTPPDRPVRPERIEPPSRLLPRH